MKFIHRLKYFLVGFGLGLLLVFFFFKDRGWDWLPGNRITTFILTNPVNIDENLFSSLQENSISTDFIYEIIENGSVLFSESNTKEKIKNYKIELDSFKITALVSFKDSSTTLINFNNLNNITNKSTVILPFHPSDSLFFSKILEKEIKASKLFLCQLREIDMHFDSITTHLHKSKLLREFSRPFKKPNPIYYSTIQFNNKRMLIHIEEGSKKIRLKSLSINTDNKSIIKEINELKEAKCF